MSTISSWFKKKGHDGDSTSAASAAPGSDASTKDKDKDKKEEKREEAEEGEGWWSAGEERRRSVLSPSVSEGGSECSLLSTGLDDAEESSSSVREEQVLLAMMGKQEEQEQGNEQEWRSCPLAACLVVANVLGPLSTESLVPSLPAIASDLRCSAALAQCSITLYMLGFGLGHLALGPLSDRRGRRPVLLWCLLGFAVSSAGCAVSVSIAALLCWRVLQSVCAATCMLLVYAIARDVFAREQQRTQALAVLGGMRPVLIACSPLLGALLCQLAHWRLLFWLLCLLALLLLSSLAVLLPESRRAWASAPQAPCSASLLCSVLSDQRFLSLSLLSCLVYAGVFVFLNEFCFAMRQQFALSLLQIGLACALCVAGLALGSALSLCLCLPALPVLFCAVCLLLCVAVWLALPFALSARCPLSCTLAPLFLYTCADGLMLPHLISCALQPFAHCAATASALQGFIRFFGAAVIALCVSALTAQIQDRLLVLHLALAAICCATALLFAATLGPCLLAQLAKCADASDRESSAPIHSLDQFFAELECELSPSDYRMLVDPTDTLAPAAPPLLP